MAALHMQYSLQKPDETEATAIDTAIDLKIRSYIERQSGLPFDEMISDEKDWDIFYHLSELRTGLISWYDFKPGAAVLEVDAGFGALTGRLCAKCAYVAATEKSVFRAQAIRKRFESADNLDIFAGDILDMEFETPFDYILLAGALEYAGNGGAVREEFVEYLRVLEKWLKPEGKFLIAVENRFGLRYFCGAPEPHVNQAFAGLRGSKTQSDGHSFSHKEIEEILQAAGMKEYKFYYPLPDYKLPQLIYTDEHLPEKNLKERLIPYYRRNDTLIAPELELYDDVVENGVFPFFANSFFVECGRTPGEGKVVYAAVSTDRGEERSFYTAIYQDKTVHKVPLYKKGAEHAGQLLDNIADLKAHGIPVVAHRLLPDGGLEMPYIEWDTLSNYLKKLMSQDTNAFLEILDRIYKYILQSSEEILPELNAMPGAVDTGLDFGPVLKKAYMELIPLNSFYDPATGEILYFDQEFVRENYPAKYVLFRAIHYIYAFTPNAEKYYPKKKLLEKYDMVQTWGLYVKEENRFLDEVRKQKTYRQFYKWASVDWKRMEENARRLESEEEIIANYQVSDRMKRIWRVELAILDEIDRICKKHNLTYFLVHGSLLGAVRHKGFIPWDDDLDIAMLRKDYDVFLEAAKTELEEPLSLHTFQTEKEIFWGGHARVRNSQTTGIETREIGRRGNLGIWVDVLPLDVCTMDERKFVRKEKKIRHCQRLILAKLYGKDFKKYGDMEPVLWKLYQGLAHLFSHKMLNRRLDHAMRLYTEEPSGDVACFSGYYKHLRLSAADFGGSVLLEFANRKLPAPIGYENYLFASMGGDYLKYPPKEERKPHHTGIFDPDRPYTSYGELFGNMFEGAGGKKVILFGAGMMFEDYMQKYGERYRPELLIDNDKNKWGRLRMGIEICSPEILLKIPKEKRHLIICSYYYKEIMQQLEEMGIQDYKVYVQEAAWIVHMEEVSRER